jgi:RNA polymerase sigma-70 factor (ECF subfamily)
MDTTRLVQRCKAGDELAWERLVRTYQSRIHALAYHYVGNAEEARDLTQDVFIRVYRALPRFEKTESFVPWMLRVARTTALDHLRRRKVRPPATDIPVEEMTSLADDRPGPHEHMESASRKRLVYRAMQALGTIHREVLLLKEIQGLSLEEIAALLDLPVGTVKSRSNRARLELAKQVLALEGETANGGAA